MNALLRTTSRILGRDGIGDPALLCRSEIDKSLEARPPLPSCHRKERQVRWELGRLVELKQVLRTLVVDSSTLCITYSVQVLRWHIAPILIELAALLSRMCTSAVYYECERMASSSSIYLGIVEASLRYVQSTLWCSVL